MAFLLANILSGSVRGQDFFRNVIYLPVTFSGVAVSLMWYFIYHPGIGLLNQLIRLATGSQFDHAWLASADTALASVTVSVAWKWVGYHIVVYLAGMTAIPGEILESARVDGATSLQLVRHIVLPFLIPMIAVSTVLITTSSLKSFDSIYVMTQGGPNHATEVLASHMYTKAFAQLRYGYGSAISVILSVSVRGCHCCPAEDSLAPHAGCGNDRPGPAAVPAPAALRVSRPVRSRDPLSAVLSPHVVSQGRRGALPGSLSAFPVTIASGSTTTSGSTTASAGTS